MNKHTPGEWIAEVSESGGSYSNPIDLYEVHNVFRRICTNIESEANARLIAAAPELYEALRALVGSPIHSVADRTELWDEARAALAKVEGE